jgi:hypothetical protein
MWSVELGGPGSHPASGLCSLREHDHFSKLLAAHYACAIPAVHL